jgi:NitT/TauT family transport system substrate-binding protein
MLGAAAAAGFAPRGARAQGQLTPLTITMEFSPGGAHIPFYIARQKGWFAEAGIDLTIKDGKGSAVTINLVGANQSDLGFTPGSALAIARPKGIPVKSIATILQKSAYGFILPKGSLLRRPEDFKGKEIVFTTGAVEGQFTEAFLAKGGLSKSDFKLVGVDSASKVASVVSGKSDAACAPVPFYTGLLKGKQEIDSLLFTDFGVNMVDIGIIASDDTIKQKGPALKKFVAVMSRAWQYTRDGHQEEAAAALRAARPDATIEVPSLVNMFNAYVELIDTPQTKGKPIGYTSPELWAETIVTLKGLNLVPKDAKAEDMYDLAFAPT